MAKKKKHKLNKNRKINNVAKNTTKNIETQPTAVISKDSYAEMPKIEQNSVISDVKFSLAVLAVIIISFVILYVILQNKSVSDQIYQVIKINL